MRRLIGITAVVLLVGACGSGGSAVAPVITQGPFSASQVPIATPATTPEALEPSDPPSAPMTPAEAVANLKEWLPDAIKDGNYQVDRWYKITITTKSITINAKHSNWVRDILEADAFDILYDIIGDLPEDSTYRPTVVIQLRSGIDTSYLKVTTPGKYLDSIFAASSPEARWRKVSKFTVSGRLY